MARPSPVSDQVRTLFEAEQMHLWSIDELHEAVVQSLGAADYSTALTMSSTTFFASPKTIIVLSM